MCLKQLFQVDGSREPWIGRRSSRLEGSDPSTMNDDDDDDERSRRCKHQHHHQLTFDMLPPASLFSPCRTTVQTSGGSVRPTAGAGVPYSVTCPCRFVDDVVDRVQPAARHSEVPPRASLSGEPVASSSATVRRLHDRALDAPRPRSCQAPSSVFEISSYIIAPSNTPVQTHEPSAAAI